MESPVRICLGAGLVVILLLLCSAPTHGLALPNDISSTTPKDDWNLKPKLNFTRNAKHRKNPDISINELSPKGSASEEHTEKNAKYKDRGRVRFGAQLRTSTNAPKLRASSETPTIIIVTPTPEVKRPAQIIDSMRSYKKTKLPTLVSSTTPISTKTRVESHEEYEDKEGEESKESYEKYSSSNFHDSFFTAPGFGGYDFNHDTENNKNRLKYESNSSPYTTSNFPSDSFVYKEDKDPFKSSFFDFDSELTTPKNEFFDNKYREVSSSIINKLDSIKKKSPPRNVTNVSKLIKENTGLERLSNNTPMNKSSVFIKNTKEIRMRDNEGAGSSNKELSDVQGTSVYYEMSVLSTETYTITHSNEDDCDNDPPSDDAVKMSSEKPPIKTEPIETEVTTKATILKLNEETLSTSPSTFFPFSTVVPTLNVVPVSTQNAITTTDKPARPPNYRSRQYSKRLSLTGVNDSPNNVTPKPETSTSRSETRKFHYTTRFKPVWMSPRGNVTRPKSSTPTTIYSEHFSIKDKLTTAKPRSPSRTVLTTVSSAEIDPVQQSDVSGTKKILHSQSVKENAIPSLRKRGSMKYGSSTPSSAEVESEISELEMPSTAWALAGLISPPSQQTAVVNITENELHKVVGLTEKKELTSTTTPTPISNEIITKTVNEFDQSKQQIQSAYVPTSPMTFERQVEVKTEKQPVEDTDPQPSETVTTESTKNNVIDTPATKEVVPLWISNAIENDTTSTKNVLDKPIPPIDATRSTGFESITKLPADVTTPQDEVVASSELNQTVSEEKPMTTTDYDITTIRFSYVPTEADNDEKFDVEFETTTPNDITPTRTKLTPVSDEPITTYRPKYMTTELTETTTDIPETTPVLEVSSQVVDEVTEKIVTTTESITTTVETETPEVEETTTTMKPETTTTPATTTIKTTTTTEPTTTVAEDTTTVVFEVVTEINTEKVTVVTMPPTTEKATTESHAQTESEENSDSNEIIHEVKTETTTKAAPVSTSPRNEPITSSVIEIETTEPEGTTVDSTDNSKIIESTTDGTTDGKSVNDLEDESRYAEMTTEASSRVLPEEAGSGAAIAIAVSTIGVIALILLIGLLVVVRRRGRRGIYAQRCTPVSLDAYSLDSVSVGHRKGNHRLRASKRSYGNPAYDDEVTSHPMQYSALANFALDVESITNEFAEIPTVTVRPEEVPPGCEDKNRYSNVLPLPETRVPLKRIGNDPTTEYINANFVTGPGNIKNYYILCQGPLSNTVADFWRMIWEQNSRLIVMLTEYMENGVEKCYEYLPPSEISDNKRIFGDFKVILKKREQRDKYAISSIQLINMATRTWREITHLWYFWPAKGVPEDYDSVIDFMFEMRSYMKVAQTAKEYDEEGVEVIYGDRSSFNNLSKLKSDDNGSGNGVNIYSPAKAEEQMRRNANNGTLSRMKAASEVEGIRPCVCVCASGAGRSGALAALDVCARALGAGAVDVPRVVRALRTQRPHSLSNRQHYIFLYKVLSEYGNKIMGGGDTI